MILSLQTWATGRPAPLRTLKQFIERRDGNTTTFGLRDAARSPPGATAQPTELRGRHVEGSAAEAGRHDGRRRPAADHHQRASSVGRGCVRLRDGQPDPLDYYERQYGGRRGAWRLLEIMAKHDVLGTWIICGATCEKYPADLARGEGGRPLDRRPRLRARDDVQLPPHEELG